MAEQNNQSKVAGGVAMNVEFGTVDKIDTIASKAEQLHGLLTMTVGDGFESFESMSADLQHATLALAAEVAGEISRSVVKLSQHLVATSASGQSMATAEPLDVKEIVGRIDKASGLFAHAAQSFADMGAIFEAVKAAAPYGSVTARLAQLGINNCETHDSDFSEWLEDYSAQAESCSAALPNHPFRRLSGCQDSSQGGA